MHQRLLEKLLLQSLSLPIAKQIHSLLFITKNLLLCQWKERLHSIILPMSKLVQYKVEKPNHLNQIDIATYQSLINRVKNSIQTYRLCLITHNSCRMNATIYPHQKL